MKHPIKLDIRLIEADRVHTPETLSLDCTPSPSRCGSTTVRRDTRIVDGIELDDDGNPVCYHVMKSHPGETAFPMGEYMKVPAWAMTHWFRGDRPEQHRGVPEITTALPLFAQLRRYTVMPLQDHNSRSEMCTDFARIVIGSGPAYRPS